MKVGLIVCVKRHGLSRQSSRSFSLDLPKLKIPNLFLVGTKPEN